MAQCKGPYKWSSKAEERVLEREEGVLKEAKFDVTCAGFKGENLGIWIISQGIKAASRLEKPRK